MKYAVIDSLDFLSLGTKSPSSDDVPSSNWANVDYSILHGRRGFVLLFFNGMDCSLGYDRS